MNFAEQHSVGVLIPCHNEKQNIIRLLENLQEQTSCFERLTRIVVISSASTDGTNERVKQFAEQSNLSIRLIIENERRGKAVAVNRGIRELENSGVIVLLAADILPGPSSIRLLVEPFSDLTVGVTGGRPIPQGPSENFTVRLSVLLWQVHHEIALLHPKSTEITVFRNTKGMLDEGTLVDEADIERLLHLRGYRVVYVPEATILTQSPTKLRDYFQQRLRVTIGHLLVSRKHHYIVGTLKISCRLQAITRVARKYSPTFTILFWGIIIESIIFLAALLQVAMPWRKDPAWKRIGSTKRQFDIPTCP